MKRFDATKECLSAVVRACRAFVPLTTRGFLFLAMSLFLLFRFGVQEQDLVFFVFGFFGLFLCCVNVFFVLLGFLFFKWRIRSMDAYTASLFLRTHTKCFLESGFRYPQIIVPFLDIQVFWIDPFAERRDDLYSHKSEEHVRFWRRGVFSKMTRVIFFQDYLGLVCIRWSFSNSCDFHIHSKPVRFTKECSNIDTLFPKGGVFRPLEERRGDRIETRAYQSSDSVRFIDWKAYSRTGQLIVRCPETSTMPIQKRVGYLVCDPFDEYAAEIAQAVMSGKGVDKGWLFGVDGGRFIADDEQTFRSLLLESGKNLNGGGGDLLLFLRRIHFSPQEHTLLLFVSGEIEYWIDSILPVLKSFTHSIHLVVGNGSNVYTRVSLPQMVREGRPWWSTLLFTRPSGEGLIEWKPCFRLQELVHQGLRITIFHENAPHVF